MIYKIQTDKGIISFSKALLNELLSEALKPWTSAGKLKLLPEAKGSKMLNMDENGLLITMHVQLAIGESISGFANKTIGFIADELIDSLEIPINDIVIYIDGVFTQKGNTDPRDLVYSYRERS